MEVSCVLGDEGEGLGDILYGLVVEIKWLYRICVFHAYVLDGEQSLIQPILSSQIVARGHLSLFAWALKCDPRTAGHFLNLNHISFPSMCVQIVLLDHLSSAFSLPHES